MRSFSNLNPIEADSWRIKYVHNKYCTRDGFSSLFRYILKSFDAFEDIETIQEVMTGFLSKRFLPFLQRHKLDAISIQLCSAFANFSNVAFVFFFLKIQETS